RPVPRPHTDSDPVSASPEQEPGRIHRRVRAVPPNRATGSSVLCRSRRVTRSSPGWVRRPRRYRTSLLPAVQAALRYRDDTIRRQKSSFRVVAMLGITYAVGRSLVLPQSRRIMSEPIFKHVLCPVVVLKVTETSVKGDDLADGLRD